MCRTAIIKAIDLALVVVPIVMAVVAVVRVAVVFVPQMKHEL
ncbi:MAG: hypothetical protein ACR2IV_15525 [Bryobacteraceae bacterium]